MKKTAIKIICLLMLFVCIASQVFAESLKTKDSEFVILKNKKVFLSVAQTKPELIKGLMYIDNLPEEKGMIFLFQEPDYRFFWMKNMKIPLDMLFIYKDKIVKIEKAVTVCKKDPCTVYESKYKADKVLELKAGFCEKYKIKNGDKIKLSSDVIINIKP